MSTPAPPPTNSADETGPDWVPQACTLPTVQRPTRLAEFDALFASVTTIERRGPDRLRLRLPGETSVARTVQALADKESQCCSFFTFGVHSQEGMVTLDVEVPPAQVAILDALAERAAGAR
jgi:hypothetical protein